MNGQELYQIYLGMKLHFSQKSYDYLTYGPKRIDVSAMGKNYVISNAISRKFATREALELRLISLFKTKIVWLNEIATPEAEKAERVHLAAINTFSYNFEQHLSLIKDEYPVIIDCFKIRNSFEVPPIARLLLNKEINLETYVALDSILGFSKNINDLVWKAEKLRVEKYRTFFNPDRKVIAQIAKKFFV